MRRYWPIALVLLALLVAQSVAVWPNGGGGGTEPATAGASDQRTPVATTLLRWVDRTRDAVRDRLRVRIELDGRSITITFGPERDRRPARIPLPQQAAYPPRAVAAVRRITGRRPSLTRSPPERNEPSPSPTMAAKTVRTVLTSQHNGVG